MQHAMKQRTQGWIPKEWEWSLSLGDLQPAECCGVFGGNRIDFIRYYVDLAIKIVEDPGNQAGWALLGYKGDYNVLIEQYHLAACVAFHRNRPGSPFREIEIRYLFDSPELTSNPNVAAELGFTHLIAGAKRSTLLAERLERRVQRDYPTQYERCIRFTSHHYKG
jgi:hypothetical protein